MTKWSSNKNKWPMLLDMTCSYGLKDDNNTRSTRRSERWTSGPKAVKYDTQSSYTLTGSCLARPVQICLKWSVWSWQRLSSEGQFDRFGVILTSNRLLVLSILISKQDYSVWRFCLSVERSSATDSTVTLTVWLELPSPAVCQVVHIRYKGSISPARVRYRWFGSFLCSLFKVTI